MIEIQNIEHRTYHSLSCILLRIEGILRSEVEKDNLGRKQIASRLYRIFPALLMLSFHAAQTQHFIKDRCYEK